MIRVVIADDEEPARRKLLDFLAREPDVTVVGEAANGEEAVAVVRSTSPDLVLLDIQMPVLDGFGVVEQVGIDRMPPLVFITAYDEHALHAFEVQALDYLLKPLSPSRFRQVLDRVRRRMASGVSPDLRHSLEQLLASVRPPARYPRQFLVEKGREREVLLAADAIDRVVADRNYLRLFAEGSEFVRRGALNDFEQRLDPEKFLRINRSEIVRLEAVAEFQPWFHGDYRVRMKDGTTLTWSRRYRARSRLE